MTQHTQTIDERVVTRYERFAHAAQTRPLDEDQIEAFARLTPEQVGLLSERIDGVKPWTSLDTARFMLKTIAASFGGLALSVGLLIVAMPGHPH